MLFFHQFRDFVQDKNYIVELMPAGWTVCSVYLHDNGVCLSYREREPEMASGVSKCGMSLYSQEIISAVDTLCGGDVHAADKAQVYVETPYELRDGESVTFHGDMDIIDIH